MVDVAEELGVDAIGLNHLMFATPEEAEQTAKILGAPDTSVIATFVTPDPGLDAAAVRRRSQALQAKCRERGIRFDFRPKVWPSHRAQLLPPGRAAARALPLSVPACEGRRSAARCTSAPSSASRSATSNTSSIEEVWNSPRYVELRKLLLERKLFPVCRRCCKVELSREAVPATDAAPRRRVIAVTPSALTAGGWAPAVLRRP